MNRRDFHRATAGTALASLVPTWLLPLSTKRKNIDLSLFCDPFAARYNLATPFVQAGKTFATDARICLKLDTGETRGAQESGKRPRADELPWFDRCCGGWQPLRSIVRKKAKKGEEYGCPACYARGRVGTDLAICECDHYDVTCANNGVDCRGWIGGEACPLCKGYGFVNCIDKLGDSYFSPSYVSLLSKLPGCEVKQISLMRAELLALAIRFDGGVGLLMPVDY